MARNAEKAMTTLARWRASQLEEQTNSNQPKRERRPYFPGDCNDLNSAQRWRLNVVRVISRKVAQIQNAGLGEHRIRDLNDQINRLLREKRNWEQRIKELGGTDFRSTERFDASAREIPGNKGYKYFGAAKDLPGVRELLTQETIQIPKKTKAELMRSIDADYYGYRDEDDGVILKEEARVQREELLRLANEEQNSNAKTIKERIELICNPDDKDDNRPNIEEGVDFAGPKNFISHVPSIPTQQEIHEELVRRKKQELLAMYVSEDILESEKEAKTMLGVE
ncbi:NineTeen Complex (NTC) component [Dermatophagoides pteronyssinus]|uniref:NineTeen Complex (NTC) component n=1 Tax=Dermatophagoides pteronyssinus TaxID=6956 RepID=A0ABQ8J1D7_DERPT|nr:NineTeen Complex (NTC) component [Dermatophagoides pteronyssinus]